MRVLQHQTDMPEKSQNFFWGRNFLTLNYYLRTKKITWCAVFFIFTLCLNAEEKVYHEKLNYRIIVPEKADEICSFAATELKKFLNETYDKPITLNGSKDKIDFYVGVSGKAVMAGFTKLPDMKENFGVFREGRTILFYGYDDNGIDPEKVEYGYAGTLLSVYYFLDKYCGTKFYFPGPEGYSLSQNHPVEFNAGTDVPEPSFKIRGFTMQTKEFTARDIRVFFRRMLCCVPRWGHEDLYYVFMSRWKKRFWKDHPEYFMMRGGKRISERYPLHIPCLSNPDVVRQAAADIVAAINENPNIHTVRLFCDAPIWQCQCSSCVDSEERLFAGGFDIKSGEEFYGFQKKVADIVHQSHPDIFFLTQTKMSSYHLPPRLVTLGSKFTVQVLNHAAFDRNNWKEAVAIAKAWETAGVRTFLKSYPRYPGWENYPIINSEHKLRYFRRFVGLTQGSIYSDLGESVPYSFCALGQFIQAKALFNVEESYDSLLKAFCSFAYPGAERDMIKFYREMERLFAKGKIGDNPIFSVYYIKNLKSPMKLLEAAAKKIKGNSRWFDRLDADFKTFYEHSLRASERAERLTTNETISIPYLNTPPNLKENPAKWKGCVEAQFITPFEYDDFQKSSMKAACDKENLFIGLIAREKDTDKLRARYKTGSGESIFRDDVFEISICPSDEYTGRKYIQIAVNSLGAHRVLQRVEGNSRIKDIDDFDMKVHTEVEKGVWFVNLKIPFKNFPEASFNTPWRTGVFRTRVLDGYNRKDRQVSGLVLWGTSYHALEQYAEFKWTGEGTAKSGMSAPSEAGALMPVEIRHR